MGMSWVSVDFRTGVVLADLPDLDVPRVGATLGTYFTTTASLPVPTAPENWLRATLPFGACLVLLDDGDPVWGGLVSRRVRSGGDVAELTLVTWEAYLGRRFVGDVVYTGEPQNDLVVDLIDRFVQDGTVPLVVEGSGGTARDRTYEDAADKTVLTVLTELAGVQGGPEWTVSWRHLTGPERYVPVLEVADRIGTGVTGDLGPSATFEMPGPVTDAVLTEDWSEGRGATSVVATSTAQADERPQSPAVVSGDMERPTVEFRFTPSTSITVVDTLTGHAQRALAVLADGSQALTLSADCATAPRLGRDWRLGDDIGYRIGGRVPGLVSELVEDAFVDTFEETFGSVASVRSAGWVETVPAFPGGLEGTARAVGWELSLAEPMVVTPILAGEAF